MSESQLSGNAESDQQGNVDNSGKDTDVPQPSSYQELIPFFRRLEEQLSLVICHRASDKATQAVLDIRSLIQLIITTVPCLPNADQTYAVAHVMVHIARELVANIHVQGTIQKIGAELVQTIKDVAMYFPKEIVHHGVSLSSALQEISDILSFDEFSSALLLHANKRLINVLQIFASMRLESNNFIPQDLGPFAKHRLMNQRSTFIPQGNYASHSQLSFSAPSQNMQRMPTSSAKTPLSGTANNIIAFPQGASNNGSTLGISQSAVHGTSTLAMSSGSVQVGSSLQICQTASPDHSIQNSSDQMLSMNSMINFVLPSSSRSGSIFYNSHNASQGENTIATTMKGAQGGKSLRIPQKKKVPKRGKESLSNPLSSAVAMLNQNAVQGVSTFAMAQSNEQGGNSSGILQSAPPDRSNKLISDPLSTNSWASATLPQKAIQGENTFAMTQDSLQCEISLGTPQRAALEKVKSSKYISDELLSTNNRAMALHPQYAVQSLCSLGMTQSGLQDGCSSGISQNAAPERSNKNICDQLSSVDSTSMAILHGAAYDGSNMVISQNASRCVNTSAITHGGIQHGSSLSSVTPQSAARDSRRESISDLSSAYKMARAVSQDLSHNESFMVFPQNGAQGINTVVLAQGSAQDGCSLLSGSPQRAAPDRSNKNISDQCSSANSMTRAITQHASHNGSFMVIPPNTSQDVNTFAMAQGGAQGESISRMPEIAAPDRSNQNISDHIASATYMDRAVAQGVNTFAMVQDDAQSGNILGIQQIAAPDRSNNNISDHMVSANNKDGAITQDPSHFGSNVMIPKNTAESVSNITLTLDGAGSGSIPRILQIAAPDGSNKNIYEQTLSGNSMARPITQDAVHSRNIMGIPQNPAQSAHSSTFAMSHGGAQDGSVFRTPQILTAAANSMARTITQNTSYAHGRSISRIPQTAQPDRSNQNISDHMAPANSMARPITQDTSHSGSIVTIPQNAAQDVSSFAMAQGVAQGESSLGIPQTSPTGRTHKKKSEMLLSKMDRPNARRHQTEMDLKRTWDPISSAKDPGMEMTVMSYNILSQKLLMEHTFLYANCKKQDLEWDTRRAILCQEIRDHFSDIICIQEMEEMEWMMEIFPFFNSHGYIGIYKKRTGTRSDGCAILFKRSKFSLIKSVPVEYCKGGILDRDNIGLIVVLQPNRPFYQGNVQKICVATTHLLFNPKRGDVKLAQLMLLLAELDKHAILDSAENQPTASFSGYAGSCIPDFVQRGPLELSRQFHPYCPTILCGDFNMEPMTDLYRFVTQGYINYSKCTARAIAGQREGQESSTYMPYIPRNLLPRHLNITENCQYASLNHNKHWLFQKGQGGNLPVNGSDPSVSIIAQFLNRFPVPSQNPAQSSVNSAPPAAETSCTPLNIAGQQSSSLTEQSDLINQSNTVTECSNGEKGQNEITPTSTSNSERNFFNSGQASHKFKFKTAYQHCSVNRGDVSEEVTSWHTRACCTLDYIFYSSGIVQVETTKPSASKHKVDSHSKKEQHTERSSGKTAKGEHDSDSPRKRRKGKSKRKHKHKRSKLDKSSSSSEATINNSIESDSEAVTIIDLVSDDERSHNDSDSLNDSLKSLNQKLTSEKKQSPKPLEERERLQLLSNFSLFTYPEILKNKPIPNAEYPSDHFCLIAKFLLR